MTQKTQPLLIGITGAIGSGKTSVAEHLVRCHGFRLFGFADALKDTVLNVLGLDVTTCYGTQAEKAAPIKALGTMPALFGLFGSPWDKRIGGPWCGRWLLEFIGTDVFRAISPNVWVDHAIRRVMAERELYALSTPGGPSSRGCNRHVIADVRFPNEMAAIFQAGGQVWETICTDRQAEVTGHVSDSTRFAFSVDFTLQAPHGHLDLLFNRADTLLSNMVAPASESEASGPDGPAYFPTKE